MSINFRTSRFNSFVNKKIKKVYGLLHQRAEVISIQRALKEIREVLTDYYLTQRRGDYTRRQASMRAQEVFSQYLQNLMYYQP